MAAAIGLHTPLLSERDKKDRSPSCRVVFLLTAGLTGYVVLGALERLVFAQMVIGMPTGVLLMHTLLALMTLSLFIVLQLARSQGGGDGQPVSDMLQRLNAFDVLSMAVLDTVHSLLALEGATAISGVTQLLLLQGTVPATTILAAVLLPSPASSVRSGASSPLHSLRLRLLHMVNHQTPFECMSRIATSHVTYRTLSAIVIAAAVAVTVCRESVPPGTSGVSLIMRHWLAHLSSLQPTRWDEPSNSGKSAAVEEAAASASALLASSDGLPGSTGRMLFALSTVVAALAAVQKRRCLMRQPTDQLVLNTCIAALQLFVGLLLAPVMLLLLRRQPVRETLVQLARGLRCCMSGFNSVNCVNASDAFGVRRRPCPVLLTRPRRCISKRRRSTTRTPTCIVSPLWRMCARRRRQRCSPSSSYRRHGVQRPLVCFASGVKCHSPSAAR